MTWIKQVLSAGSFFFFFVGGGSWMHHPDCFSLWAEFLVCAGKVPGWAEWSQSRRVVGGERIFTCWTAAVWFKSLLQSLEILRAWALRMTDTLLPNGIKDGGGDRNYFRKVSHFLQFKNGQNNISWLFVVRPEPLNYFYFLTVSLQF